MQKPNGTGEHWVFLEIKQGRVAKRDEKRNLLLSGWMAARTYPAYGTRRIKL